MTASHVVEETEITLGRGEDNQIVVAGQFISLHHAHVLWDGAQHLLKDVSKNGTYVNGSRILDVQPLRQGDVITLPGLPGLTLTFDQSQVTTTWSPAEPTSGTLRVDLASAEVWVGGTAVHLRRKEYMTLALLWRDQGKLVRKEQLALEVWPEHGGEVADMDITQVISGLRRKIEEVPDRPRHLLTVRGLGYRLVPG